jgi:hypothetical protein
MSPLLLLESPLPVTIEAPATGRCTLSVSYVQNARENRTEHCDVPGIIEWIRDDSPFKTRARIENIRRKFQSVMDSTGNDRAAAKKAIDELKKRLPGVMWSGTFAPKQE